MALALLGRHNKIASKSSKKDAIFFYALVLLPVIQFVIFYIIVNFNSILLSFQKYDLMSNGFTFLSGDNLFKNFSDVFNLNNRGLNLGGLVLNSVVLWLCTVAFGTIPAIVFSFYIYRKRLLYRFFKFFLFLPSVIPSILLTTVFRGYMVDFVSKIMGLTGDGLLDPMSSTAFPILLIYYIWISFGAQVLFYTNSMAQVSPSLIEAGQLDGCSETRLLTHVVLPGILSTVKTFIIVSIAGIFTNQMLLYNFYGNIYKAPDIATIGYFIYSMAAPGPSNYDNYPLMSAFGLCCSVVAIFAVFVVNRLFKRFER